MAGITRRVVKDLVYEALTTNIVGGMVCEYVAGATVSGRPGIRPCSAGSAVVVGVAYNDAVTEANRAALETGTGNDGYPFISTGIADAVVTCENDAVVGGVTFAAATTFRQPVKAAANGQVTPWVSGTDLANLIIGWCAEEAGVATAGVGKLRISI